MVTDKQLHEAAVALTSKGGNTTKQRYGMGYYEAIGKKGGQKVKELIARGKKTRGE